MQVFITKFMTRAGDKIQLVECLLCMPETLGSIPNIRKQKTHGLSFKDVATSINIHCISWKNDHVFG